MCRSHPSLLVPVLKERSSLGQSRATKLYLARGVSDLSRAGLKSCQQILVLSGESPFSRCSLPYVPEDSNSEFGEYLQKVTSSFVIRKPWNQH